MNDSKKLNRRFLKAGSTTRFVAQSMPVFYFLFALGMVYITTALMSEKRIRNIEYLKKDIRELRWEYMSEKAELMHASTYSRVAQAIIGENEINKTQAPKRIITRHKP